MVTCWFWFSFSYIFWTFSLKCQYKKNRKSSFIMSNTSILHWSWLWKNMIKSNNQEMHLGLKLIFVCICLLMQRYPSSSIKHKWWIQAHSKITGIRVKRPRLIGNVWFCHFCKTWNTLLKVHFAALCRWHIHKRHYNFSPLQMWVY